MSAILKCADLSCEQFLRLLDQLKRPEDAASLRCWIEAPDGWSFDWWPGLAGRIAWSRAASLPSPEAANEAVLRSFAGRLFAPDGEIRWRHIPSFGDSSYRCVFLGHTDWVGEDLQDQSEALNGLTPRNASFLLWGQQTDASPGEWIELRIPHRFRYPIEGNPKGVLLETEQWLAASSHVEFIRFSQLKPYREAQ